MFYLFTEQSDRERNRGRVSPFLLPWDPEPRELRGSSGVCWETGTSWSLPWEGAERVTRGPLPRLEPGVRVGPGVACSSVLGSPVWTPLCFLQRDKVVTPGPGTCPLGKLAEVKKGEANSSIQRDPQDQEAQKSVAKNPTAPTAAACRGPFLLILGRPTAMGHPELHGHLGG